MNTTVQDTKQTARSFQRPTCAPTAEHILNASVKVVRNWRENYAAALPHSSSDSNQPSLFGKNPLLFDKAWEQLPLSDRLAILHSGIKVCTPPLVARKPSTANFPQDWWQPIENGKTVDAGIRDAEINSKTDTPRRAAPSTQSFDCKLLLTRFDNSPIMGGLLKRSSIP
jgi:hypothetical protein